MCQAKIILSMVLAISTLGSTLPASAHEDTENWLSASAKQESNFRLIPSKVVGVNDAEREAGVIGFKDLLPHLQKVNERFHIFSPQAYQHFVENFHYPFRQSFDLNEKKPPTQVVLHWTANKRTDIPLYTLSAFLRRMQRGRVVERPHAYKNVSNYFLTGNIAQTESGAQAQLVKMTRGDLSHGGDIPRVTAYPTGDAWDDNKYDGRGAIGIEIESPDFTTFYQNSSQREKLHNFLILVLKERGVLKQFQEIRESAAWDDLLKIHAYLSQNLKALDVQSNGGIPRNWQLLHLISRNIPGIQSESLKTAESIFQFISGHGVIAHEYNRRMVQAGRPKEADYDKIDFTEPHVFLVAMDLLKSEMHYLGNEAYQNYDLATQRLIDAQKQTRTVSDLSPVSHDVGSISGPPLLFYQAFPSSDEPNAVHEPH